jgi:hypothetical protein
MQTYSEDSNEDFVACDECDMWIHFKCTGVAQDKLATMEKYVCPLCKKKKTAGSAGV